MPIYSLDAGCRNRSRKTNRDWISSPDTQLWVVVVVAIVANTLILVKIVNQSINTTVCSPG